MQPVDPVGQGQAELQEQITHSVELPLRILVAEDDENDVWLLRRAFTRAGVQAAVDYVRDGQEVIDYLLGKEPFENAVACPTPTLLLLDLKMPRVDGFQVLEWLGQQPRLRNLVVAMVLSGSDFREDVHRAYALGARRCFVKPRDPDELVALVQSLETYWHELQHQALEAQESSARPALAKA